MHGLTRPRPLACACALLFACDPELAPADAAPAARAAPQGAVMGLAGDGPGEGEPAVVCADGPTIQGIDVSYWQGSINWQAVAGDGIDFAFIRASDGTGYIDEKFEANWSGARDSGLLVGAYQYFRPSQDPIAQADILLNKMGPLGPGILPPVIDVETSEGLAPNQVASKVGKWIDHVEGKLGVKPIVYTGKYIWEGQVGSAAWASYPLWIAQYGPVCPDLPNQWSEWSFFQTSASGKVAGISGNTDMDLFNGDLAALEALAGDGGMASCGDGSCGGAEDSDSCPADCPPCGVIPPEGGIIDDLDGCFQRFGNPMYWYSKPSGWDGGLTWTHAVDAQSPDNYAIWALHFAEAGVYRLEAYVDAEGTSEATSYLITDADGDASLAVDQSAHDGWVDLGERPFAAGGQGQRVRLNDNTGEPFADKRQIVFDAIRLTRLDAPSTTSDGTDSGSASDSASGSASDSSASDSASASASDAGGSTTDSGGGSAGTDSSASASDSASSAGSGSASASATASASASASESAGLDPDGDAGCACASGRREGGAAQLLLLLALGGLGRRRRGPR